MGPRVLYYGYTLKCTVQFTQTATTFFYWFSLCFPPKAESLVKDDDLFFKDKNYM